MSITLALRAFTGMAFGATWAPIALGIPAGPLAAADSSVLAGPPGVVESRAIVFEHPQTDPYDRTNNYGFNHAPSVTCLGGERVIAAWFSGPFEASVHQVILGATSEDGGRSWQRARVLHDAPRVSDFDPGFVNSGDRNYLFFSLGRWEERPTPGLSKHGKPHVGVDSFSILTSASDDRGETWGEPREVGAGPGWNCRSNGIRLSNGTLLIPTHHLKFPHISSVLLSTDQGLTWKRGPDIQTPDGVGAGEPSVAELEDGELVMALRTTDGALWLARSKDYGSTWLPPEKQNLPAATSSANLFCTSSGKLALTHNPDLPHLRTELTLRTSEDGGRSWSDPIKVAEIESAAEPDSVWSRQVSYPSVCELPDGTLLVTWARIALGPDIQSGVIDSARVRLN